MYENKLDFLGLLNAQSDYRLGFFPQFKENDDWWGCGWI